MMYSDGDYHLMSKALELALVSIPNKPRLDFTTADLVTGILHAADSGIRDEEALAEAALKYVFQGRSELSTLESGHLHIVDAAGDNVLAAVADDFSSELRLLRA
jgi:hypothetical protein